MRMEKVIIEQASDGCYSAYMTEADDLDYGVIGTGYSIEETVADFKAAYEGIKQEYEKQGKHFIEVEFNFTYDVTSFLKYYSNKLTLAGLGRITGVSAAQLSQYLNGYRNPSKKTAEKIEKGLHSFAKEISQVHFV